MTAAFLRALVGVLLDAVKNPSTIIFNSGGFDSCSLDILFWKKQNDASQQHLRSESYKQTGILHTFELF